MDKRQLKIIIPAILQKSGRKKTNFYGIYASNQLTKDLRTRLINRKSNFCGLVVNTAPIIQTGEHWQTIAIDHQNKKIEFFCSFGTRPRGRIKLFLVGLMKDLHYTLLYSTTQFQNFCSSYCGHFCVLFYFCRFNGITYKDFLHLFDATDFEKNDRLVRVSLNVLLSNLNIKVPKIDKKNELAIKKLEQMCDNQLKLLLLLSDQK